jgi:probable F420-dependent oxidoreductase
MTVRFWQAMVYADPTELVEAAPHLERAGFHGVTMGDHLFFPHHQRSRYPYSRDGLVSWQPGTAWPDPWVAFGAMAAVTSSLCFATDVYVAPARDPFSTVKAVSTAAVLSGNRVALGVGAGWCADEFAQTGQEFANRGARLDELIPVLRTLLTGERTEWQGTHYRFDAVQVSPAPTEPVPIYLGGHSAAALRRAARLGDGWIGAFTQQPEADRILDALNAELAAAGRDRGEFRIILSLLGNPGQPIYRDYARRGVTDFVAAPWGNRHPDLGARLTAATRFAERIIAPLSDRTTTW